MGFDIHGKSGNYFRNSVWSWKPLWEFVVKNSKDKLTVQDYEKGFFNDSHVITEGKAKLIAERLGKLLDAGSVRAYKIEYDKKISDMKDVNCDCCNGTGDREDMVFYEKKGKTVTKGTKGAVRVFKDDWAKEMNGCNGCKGTGKVRPWQSRYPFTEGNVKEFADFCAKSKGFRIS
jgi:hypothetical protein